MRAESHQRSMEAEAREISAASLADDQLTPRSTRLPWPNDDCALRAVVGILEECSKREIVELNHQGTTWRCLERMLKYYDASIRIPYYGVF